MLAKSQPTPIFNVVTEPTDNDILCGRSIHYYTHSGNLALRAFVELKLEDYLSCKRKRDKTELVRAVINTIFRNGGRFLKRRYNASLDICWYDGGLDAAKSRVSVAIRDAKSTNKTTDLMKSTTGVVDDRDRSAKSRKSDRFGDLSPTAVSSPFFSDRDTTRASPQHLLLGRICYGSSGVITTLGNAVLQHFAPPTDNYLRSSRSDASSMVGCSLSNNRGHEQQDDPELTKLLEPARSAIDSDDEDVGIITAHQCLLEDLSRFDKEAVKKAEDIEEAADDSSLETLLNDFILSNESDLDDFIYSFKAINSKVE
jgi:hypothetical protein